MHTAEHILNSVMSKNYTGARSFSNHIEKKKSKCDYHFDRNLTDEETENITKSVNEVIKKELDITESYIPRSEAEKHFSLSNLPDEAGEELRIIKVGDFDTCLCSGPHVNNTREIGEFVFGSSSFEEGVLRIRFNLKRPD
ncbi:MAG: hypothetical protein KKA84_07180 [Bacteroidetes bacterium]|nr:hypothetical protein [Bacteroidota bacterium]